MSNVDHPDAINRLRGYARPAPPTPRPALEPAPKARPEPKHAPNVCPICGGRGHVYRTSHHGKTTRREYRCRQLERPGCEARWKTTEYAD